MTHPRDETLWSFLVGELRTIASADGRTVRSFRDLFRHPGRLTRDYFDDHSGGYLPPFQLFLLANVLFFVIGGITGNHMLTTTLSSQMCCQTHSAYATAQVKERVAGMRAASWRDATRDSSTETLRDSMPVSARPPATPAQLRADSVKYRLLVTRAYTQFETKFNMISEQSARTLVILMVPLFALVIAVLEFRRGSALRHLVFSLHFYAFALLVYIVTWVLELVGLQFGVMIPDGFWAITVVGGQAIYIAIAMREVYGDGRIARTVKGLAAGFSTAAILLTYRFLLFLVAFHAS